MQNRTKNAAATAEAKNAASLKGCLKECMVYKVKVSTKNNFKSRFYNYTKSFRDRSKATKLSEYIWQLTGESKN